MKRGLDPETERTIQALLIALAAGAGFLIVFLVFVGELVGMGL